jgi:16S rRNA (guanine527-N7)-methyltransferase
LHVSTESDARRPALPTDAAALEPMGAAFEAAVEAGLSELGLDDSAAATAEARASYELHARLLREWNAAINLTAIRDPAEVAWRHVIDALSAVPHLASLVRPGASLLDLGSGGGYPGLPLAAGLPVARVALLDSVGKKARFLAVAGAAVAAALGPGGGESRRIEAIAERAEDIAEEWDLREAWDVVTARAVGSLADVLELGLPLVREGGIAVAWKRDDGDGLRDELRQAGTIIRAAGGGRPRVVAAAVARLEGHRLVLVPKERTTPIAYPRPVSVRRARRS